MKSRIEIVKNYLVYKYDGETLRIEPWGENGFRVRSTHMNTFSDENWALLPQKETSCEIADYDDGAVIKNGRISARISQTGVITFLNCDGQVLLEEYVRNHGDVKGKFCAIDVDAREFRAIPYGDYRLTVRFESAGSEKIYGMGQYQIPYLDLKNSTLELAARNSQISVPFMISSLGYGFLWNNPAIGGVSFSKNLTEWVAESTTELDYWITAGNTPAEIEQAYAAVTGTVPMMPEYAMGFWQCKLRYQTQAELLEVAREYKRRNLPISIIVADFFHWTNQGEWKFDPQYWPDPAAMVQELDQMGIKLMVSVWPTVDKMSENYQEMMQKGYLVKSDSGMRTMSDFLGNCIYYDATNPDAREFLWKTVKKNYYDLGIKLFWLDNSQPGYPNNDFRNYRTFIGTTMQTGNVYSMLHAEGFYDGLKKEGEDNILSLVCAWAGSQRYGALAWSGDVQSSFESFRCQVCAGLNMGLAGMPWWTTDIGGFVGGRADDASFRELLIRWFEFGAFSPVFRLHGHREPSSAPLGSSGGGICISGAPNEVWSFGEEAYAIFQKYLQLREKMRPYLQRIMAQAHKNGTPVIRPLFYDFPADQKCWEIEDEYMFGPDVLVAPILYENQRSRSVYLPLGAKWTEANTGKIYEGGLKVDCEAPIDIIPVFIKDEADAGFTLMPG